MKTKHIVLLVDSMPVVCCLLAVYLADEFQIVIRSNTADALAWLRAGNRPAAVVTHFDATDAQPYALFRFMHAVPELRKVPVIVHAAQDQSLATQSRLRKMTQTFLQAGAVPEEVMRRVTSLLAA